MSLEIYVGGNIDLALQKLKRDFQKNLSKDLARHSFYESPGLRKKRKRLKSIQRLKKLESRSLVRVTEARRLHDKRKTEMGPRRT